MKNFWLWIVKSSADPTRTSLTVKATLVALIPFLVGFAPLVGLTGEGVNQIVLNLSDLVGQILMVVASLTAVYGLIRKILNSFK